MPADYEGPTDNKSESLGVEYPGEKYDLDPALEPNKFPRESGNDTYQNIPGDGVVPG